MKKILPYFIIFCLTAALFFWLQSSPTLGDGDSFYHAKITELMIKQRGPVKNFPWLPFTTLKEHYTDHHFLFHLYLIPFILIFKNPLVAIKIATILLAATFFVIFYWLLKKWRIKYAFIFAILPLVNYVLPFRLALAKAPASSLIILILGIAALLSRKHIWLFFISFVYVWTHGGWPMILITTICYCLADALKSIIDNPPELPAKIKNEKQKIKNTNKKLKNIFIFLRLYFLYFISYFWFLSRLFFTKSNLKLLLSCLLGLIAGIIINPYFPQNLNFYWVQTFKVAVVNYHTKIGVGAEWLPYDPFDLFRENLIISLLWLFTFAWFLVSFKKPKKIFPTLEPLEPQLGQTKEGLFVIILSTLLFLYTIKARRMAEYFFPLVSLSTAFTFNRSLILADWAAYWQHIKKFIINQKFLILNILLSFLFVTGLGMIIGSTINLYQRMRQYFTELRPFDNFQKTAEFLKANTPPGSIIFHSCWTYFPMLFYYNDQNYYISGLDSTFFYDKNPELYKIWRDIVQGKNKENLAKKIKNNFNSSYVVAEKPKAKGSFKEKFIENLDNDNHFQKIYEDEEVNVYLIK